MDDDAKPFVFGIVGLVLVFAVVVAFQSCNQDDARWSAEIQRVTTQKVVTETAIPSGDGMASSTEKVISETKILSTGWEVLTVAVGQEIYSYQKSWGGVIRSWVYAGRVGESFSIAALGRFSSEKATHESGYQLFYPVKENLVVELDDEHHYEVVSAETDKLTIRRKKR